MNKQLLEDQFGKHEARFLADWMSLIRFASISTDPDRAGECSDCADWLKSHLSELGFTTDLVETASNPLVYAELAGSDDSPVILFYGHYDVQPVDPIEDWQTPPFEPEVRDGRVYGRGAEDNKGQLMYVLKAIETLIEHDALNCTLRILIEGQEECGSADTIGAVMKLGDKLKADILMVCDTGTVASGTPTLLMGLRGMVHLTAKLKGPKRDLHSGVHGGRAPNPAAAMARLVSSLFNPDGTIAVADYYDGITEPSEEERARAQQSAADTETYIEQTGVPPVDGDQSVSHAERTGFLPSLDINGIHSGYGGAGTKTIIPSEATVKISSRIVPGQDPEHCLSLLKAHLESHKPDGLVLELSDCGAPGGALRLPLESEVASAAAKILRELGGDEPAMLWEGASIPVIGVLADVSGADPVLVGFAAEADNAHAVDESFSLEQFRRGYLYAGMFLGSQ